MHRLEVEQLFKNAKIEGLRAKYGTKLESVVSDGFVFQETVDEWAAGIGEEIIHIKGTLVPLIKMYAVNMRDNIAKHMSEAKEVTQLGIYNIPDVIYAKEDMEQFRREDLPSNNNDVQNIPMPFPKEELTVNAGPLANDMNDYMNGISKETLVRVWETYINGFEVDNLFVLNLTGTVLLENGKLDDLFVLYALTECMITNTLDYNMSLGDYEYIANKLNSYVKHAIVKLLSEEDTATKNDYIFTRGNDTMLFTTRSLYNRAISNDIKPELLIGNVKHNVTISYIKEKYTSIVEEAAKKAEIKLVDLKEAEASNIKGMYVVAFRKLDLPRCTEEVCPDIENSEIFNLLNHKTPFELQDSDAVCSEIISEVLYGDTNIVIHMETINKYLNEGVSIDTALYLTVEDAVCWHVSRDIVTF